MKLFQANPNLFFAMVLVVLPFLSENSDAQGIAKKNSDLNKVSVGLKMPPEKIHPGSSCLVTIILHVMDGWHINSAFPTDENLIATSIDIEHSNVLDSVAFMYPKANERQFGFSETPLEVYEDTIEIPVKIFVASNAKTGQYVFPIIVGYQACNDNICLAPTTITSSLKLHIARRDSSSQTNRK